MSTYPLDTYKINDNTKTRNLSSQNSGPVFFAPFVSDKGIDGVIKTWNDRGRFREEFGDSDISVHGQSFAQCENILDGGCVLKAIRITAKNAINSNIAVVLNIKTVSEQKTNAAGELLYKDATTGEDTTVSAGNEPIMIKKAVCKHVLKTFDKPTTNKDNFDALLRTLFKEGNASEGVDIPLFGAVCRGKGAYGNMYRFRLTPDVRSDIGLQNRRYNFTLFKNENGLEQVGVTLRCSTSPYAKDRENHSLFIQDVIEINGSPILLRAIPESYAKAIEILHPILLQEDPQIREDQVDILTFVDGNMNKYKNISIDPDSVDFTIPEGIGLDRGDDGDFKRTNINRDDAINERLISLFKGDIDKSINDRKRLSFQLLLDANFPLEVKREMVNLHSRRKEDFVLITDGNKLMTVANAKSFLKEEFDIDNRAIATYINNFDIIENNTRKIITVTTPYLISKLLPRHILERGNQTPFAGLDITLDEYIVPDSIRPAMDEIDEKEICDLNGNFIHEEGGKTIFATILTRQKETSELSYLQNILVLNDILDDLRELSSIFRYKFTGSSDDFRTLNNLADQKMTKYRDVKCAVAEAEVMPNPNDATGKRVKTKVKVAFRQFNMANDVEIDIEFA